MFASEYKSYDALGLAQLIGTGSVSPVEVRNAALEAIAQSNGVLNAIVEILEGSTSDLREGPFRGVPFLVKDLVLHREGGTLEMGCRLARGMRTPSNTYLMDRFIDAGLQILGRTNTPELGHGCTTEPVLYGPTRNPWNTSRMAGGSSGGSAAAVAAGMVPIAHGNDGGGSLRNPAACCGLFAMKPSRGRVSLGPDTGEALFGMGIEGVLSRTVRDSAAMLDWIAKPYPGDPYVVHRQEGTYLDEVRSDPGSLKIAVTTDAWSGATISPDCVNATLAAAKLCADLGHRVEVKRPEFDYPSYRRAQIDAWAAGIAGWVNQIANITGRKPDVTNLEAATYAMYRHGLSLSATDLLSIPATINTISRCFGNFFQEYDIVITPCTATTAAPLMTYQQNKTGITGEEWFDHKGSFTPFLAVFNMTGQPAMSVPLSEGGDGLPIGIQFAAGSGREDLLFRLAGQLEQASPWKHRQVE